MPFGPFPSLNLNAIQLNMLERRFIDCLTPYVAYRSIARQEPFPAKIGSTLTMTKKGLMVPNTTPLNPATNTGLDNGLTQGSYGTEQYILSISQIAQDYLSINFADDEITISNFLAVNIENLATAQATALDRIAQKAILDPYMGGNTVVTASAVATTTVAVDDVRGFQTKMVNGVITPISALNTLLVTINGIPHFVSGAAEDVINVSSALPAGGRSGTLTITVAATVTIGEKVLASNAPAIVRPNNRASTDLITSADIFNLNTLLTAVTYLRNNNVPKVKRTGKYHCFVDGTTMSQIFQDPSFQLLYRGETLNSLPYRDYWVAQAFDVIFIQTTEAVQQLPDAVAPVPVSQYIHRPILCGDECLIEGQFMIGIDAVKRQAAKIGQFGDDAFANISAWGFGGVTAATGGNYLYLRPPLDRLGQEGSQTSTYIGGFVAPTDSLTNKFVVRTASDADYKRCVVMETA